MALRNCTQIILALVAWVPAIVLSAKNDDNGDKPIEILEATRATAAINTLEEEMPVSLNDIVFVSQVLDYQGSTPYARDNLIDCVHPLSAHYSAHYGCDYALSQQATT